MVVAFARLCKQLPHVARSALGGTSSSLLLVPGCFTLASCPLSPAHVSVHSSCMKLSSGSNRGATSTETFTDTTHTFECHSESGRLECNLLSSTWSNSEVIVVILTF